VIDLSRESGESDAALKRQAGLPSVLPPEPRGSTDSSSKRDVPALPPGPRGSTDLADKLDLPALPPRQCGSSESLDEHEEILRVANLQLCRKVNGFGSFERLAEATVRPGQRVLLYCEMTGVSYEATGADFTSRLRARVELRAADSETTLWEQELGIARDVCPRIRHDYYVSYFLTLPESLHAGPHRLRLVQTDLAADRSSFSELRLIVVR
jgi:hypothetical protein